MKFILKNATCLKRNTMDSDCRHYAAAETRGDFHCHGLAPTATRYLRYADSNDQARNPYRNLQAVSRRAYWP